MRFCLTKPNSAFMSSFSLTGLRSGSFGLLTEFSGMSIVGISRLSSTSMFDSFGYPDIDAGSKLKQILSLSLKYSSAQFKFEVLNVMNQDQPIQIQIYLGNRLLKLGPSSSLALQWLVTLG